ncbi:hypothetical protein CFOL_v3_14915, partial [Cephalotus follicularis]
KVTAKKRVLFEEGASFLILHLKRFFTPADKMKGHTDFYRFFLDKEYGSLFSSLMTGLYLTFKLTSVVEKVQPFFAAVKALWRKEVHYRAYATLEQVEGIFSCSIYVSRFERERTCPLCRALVKPTDLRSFGDGSTSLFFQLF